MNELEDRIRAATRAAGDTVRPGSVPPLRLPAELVNGRDGVHGSQRWGGPARHDHAIPRRRHQPRGDRGRR